MADTTTLGGTKVDFASAPDWYAQYVADLSALGGALAQSEYVGYEDPRIAEWTPDQQLAFSKVRDAVGMWEPYAEKALNAYTAAGGGLDLASKAIQQGGTFNRFAGTPVGGMGTTSTLADGSKVYSGAEGIGRIAEPGQLSYQQFYDLYQPSLTGMQNAIDQIGQRNFTNTTLKGLSDTFTGSGQFGSGRHQILGADAAAQAQAQIEEQKAGIANQVTQQSLNDYLKWNTQQGQMGSTMMGAAGNYAKYGTDLMNFGQANQQAAMGDAAAIGNIGTQQQQMNQQNLNLGYQDFVEQRDYPWQQLDKWSQLTKGNQIPQYQSSVTTPAVTPTTQVNPWTQGVQGFGGAWAKLNTAFS